MITEGKPDCKMLGSGGFSVRSGSGIGSKDPRRVCNCEAGWPIIQLCLHHYKYAQDMQSYAIGRIRASKYGFLCCLQALNQIVRKTSQGASHEQYTYMHTHTYIHTLTPCTDTLPSNICTIELCKRSGIHLVQRIRRLLPSSLWGYSCADERGRLVRIHPFRCGSTRACPHWPGRDHALPWRSLHRHPGVHPLAFAATLSQQGGGLIQIFAGEGSRFRNLTDLQI